MVQAVPLWAIFSAVLAGAGGLVAVLIRLNRTLAAVRDQADRIERHALEAEERTRHEQARRDGVGRAGGVDGWLDPVIVRRPGSQAVDGLVLCGRVANRTEAPVWDVLAEVVDPRSGQTLPLVPLTTHVLPPGAGWPLEWISGSAVTPPGPLPVPSVLVRAATARPQLRITFSDAGGRWVRQGAWVAPATRELHLAPGSAALSRAAEDIRRAEGSARTGSARTEEGAADPVAGRGADPVLEAVAARVVARRVAAEVALAVQEVARHRLGRFSDGPLDLAALPGFLTLNAVAPRLRLDPVMSPDGPDQPAGTEPGDRPARSGTVTRPLAATLRSIDERVNAAPTVVGSLDGDEALAFARHLLAHAMGATAVLNALRCDPADAVPAPGTPTSLKIDQGSRARTGPIAVDRAGAPTTSGGVTGPAPGER